MASEPKSSPSIPFNHYAKYCRGFIIKSTYSVLLLLQAALVDAQHISQFNSLAPGPQEAYLTLPSTHSFQLLISEGDSLTDGTILPPGNDFTGYIPIDGSSMNGFLSINSEHIPGGVTLLDVQLDELIEKWVISNSQAVDFSTVGGTARNCSGTVTPWETMVTCEEITSEDVNGDSYKDLGWSIEIDPITKQVIDHPGGLPDGDKLWALGNFKHENMAIHTNRRTVYQGVDDNPGYLFKYVADTAGKLSSGRLYVYKGSKSGSGEWHQLNNTSIDDQNNTLTQCAELDATVFMGIEDVEINPLDGSIHLAVKNENRVYRFEDSDPLNGTSVSNFHTYVGDTTYQVSTGEITSIEPWGTGNDNLCFDNLGNLWVTQDGDHNYIWLVENGHSQQSPKVKIFARTPKGSEPTGITFTPDFNYMFLSIQHPDTLNSVSTQLDAFGEAASFDKSTTIVVSLTENFNEPILPISKLQEGEPFNLHPNPGSEYIFVTFKKPARVVDYRLFDSSGKELKVTCHLTHSELLIPVHSLQTGIYIIHLLINGEWFSRKLSVER